MHKENESPALNEQKDRSLTSEQNLQRKLVEEIEKKKIAIKNLKSEIINLAEKCKKLSEVLGITKPTIEII